MAIREKTTIKMKERVYRQLEQQIGAGSEAESRDKYMKLLKEIWFSPREHQELYFQSSTSETYLVIRGGAEVVAEVTGGVRYAIRDIEESFDGILTALGELRAQFDLIISGGG